MGQGLHKREAEPSYAAALAYHPAGEYGYNKDGPGYSYTDRSPQGARLHKRQLVGGSALTLLGLQALGYGLAGQTGLLNNNRYRYGKREAEPSYAPALAYHPAGEYGYNKYGPGYSYTDRSPQGARLHKRQLVGGSALTLAGLQLLGYGLAGQTGLLNNNRNRFRGKGEAEPSYAPALAYHPAGGYGYNTYGAGTSYVDRSPQGLHKRSTYGYTPALAYHPAGGYGYNKYGSGTSYVYRSPPSMVSVSTATTPTLMRTVSAVLARGPPTTTPPLSLTTLLEATATTSTVPEPPTCTGPPRVFTRGPPTATPPLLLTTPLAATATTSTVPAPLTCTGPPRAFTRGRPLVPATRPLSVLTATVTTAGTLSTTSRSTVTTLTSTRAVMARTLPSSTDSTTKAL